MILASSNRVCARVSGFWRNQRGGKGDIARRAINPRHNPTQDTLNRLLRPLKLNLTLAPLEPSNWIHRSRPKRYQPTMHLRAGSTR
jgi:hypothetical protein